MVAFRLLPIVLLAAAGAAHAQLQEDAPLTGVGASRPSVSSVPSVPSVADTGGTVEAGGADGSAAPRTSLPSPNARPALTGSTSRGPSPQLIGEGTFGSSGTGLENVLNSGTPPSWDRKSGVRKVCPPELENRNNVCVAPVGSVIRP